MSASDNQNSASWTYRMEVSPTGASGNQVAPGLNDPVALLHLLLNLQSQTLETQRQMLDIQRQQLELVRESTQVAREQRARQVSDLERWQSSHEGVIDYTKLTLAKLEKVHAALMNELVDYVGEHYENLVEGDYSLSDFVDRFGPRLAHLNTMLAVLRPLTLALGKKQEG